jgi:hypothetical protein
MQYKRMVVYTVWCTINVWFMYSAVRENNGLYSVMHDKHMVYVDYSTR